MAVDTTTDQGLPGHVKDLVNLISAYAKQETIEPLKGLGRFVAFGLAGSTLLGLGLVLLALAGLRALQTETGSTFEGGWSWAPYGIVLLACAVVAGLSAAAIGRGPAKPAKKANAAAKNEIKGKG